jgi:transcriptional regulator with XRE-family HTH domain
MAQLFLHTPQEIADLLAQRARQLRLARSWSRDTLSSRAGVTSSSLKRFENTGLASLDLVLKVAQALGRLDDFADILKPPPASTMAELERRTGSPRRQRGRK